MLNINSIEAGPENLIAQGKKVLDIEIEALACVRDKLAISFEHAVKTLAACQGRVILTGIGKSGLVGRKIAATLSSTGTPAFFVHPVEGQHGDLGSVRQEDVVIAISYSGKTQELLAILPAFRSLGVRLIAVTSGLASPLAEMADIVIDAGIPREACNMNLVPTSSTTAVLALGDALAVCLMVKKQFTSKDFYICHPGGSLGQRLSLSITDIMHTENIPLVQKEGILQQALTVLNEKGYGAVIVIDQSGQLAGIITDGDIRRLFCEGAADPQQPIAEVMRKNPCYASLGMSAAELMDIMEKRGITVLPVLDDNNKVAGIAHLHDLLGKGHLCFAI